MTRAADNAAARNDDFRAAMREAGTILPRRAFVTATRSRITARVSTLRAKAIADWPGHVGEELVWRVDNHKAVKRRRKTTRFAASDLQPVGPVLFLSYDE